MTNEELETKCRQLADDNEFLREEYSDVVDEKYELSQSHEAVKYLLRICRLCLLLGLPVALLIGYVVGHVVRQQEENVELQQVKADLYKTEYAMVAERKYADEEIRFLQYANEYGFCDPRDFANLQIECEASQRNANEQYKWFLDCEKKLERFEGKQ